MFHVYSGNHLEDLSIVLNKILSLTPPKNAFQSEHVLVQSPGMAQWLKMALAEQQGVSAGTIFPLPSTFVWQCFQQSIPDIPMQSEFNKPFLVWRLMTILPSRLKDEAFSSLAWYLKEDDSQMRLYQLCASIADIFDQYLVYRPKWISAWEANDESVDEINKVTEKQPWQAILWRDLVADVSQRNGSLFHRANLVDALREATRNGRKPSSLPDRIFIFGVSSLPPNTLDALQVLAKSGWIEVHLFMLNPSRFYWGDVVDKQYLNRQIKRQPNKPGLMADKMHLDANPLLSSWGRLGRDYILQLMDLADNQLDVFEDYIDEARMKEGEHASLLSYIQQDILNLDNHGSEEERTASAKDSSYKHIIASDDVTVQFHSCHSALREVEVLHDQLLSMFEQDSQLTPKDIIVMLPDVNQYSPFIQSVFLCQPDHKRIPFALVDLQANQETPLIDAYVRLLSLVDSRCTLSELISILEVPAVLARFELSVDELERIRQWSNESGVRWGLDSSTAEHWSLPVETHNTWQNGLKRMLLGYAVGHDTIWNGLLSYGEIEGLEAHVAGKLAQFLQSISVLVNAMRSPRLPDEWVVFLYDILSDFFDLDDDDVFAPLLSKHINDVSSEWRTANFNTKIDLAVLRQILAPRLQEPQGGQRFLAGRVNFCTLMPMRSVPFSVVCLLGLNEGAYPRTQIPVGFDLMVGNYQKGDRSRREDDKYLFLEATLSARQRLYISYIGRSIRDNSELTPSILVSELMEYIGQSCVLATDVNLIPEASQQALLSKIVVEHSLQPFNERYYLSFQESSVSKRLFSYEGTWVDALRLRSNGVEEDGGVNTSLALSKAPLPMLEQDTDEVDFAQFIRFFTHPARYFYQRRLKAYLSIREIQEQEDEPFTLSYLAALDFREQALQAYENEAVEGFKRKLQLSGEFPYGEFGEMSLQELLCQCEAMMKASPIRKEIDLPKVEIQLGFKSATGAQTNLIAWLDRWDRDRRVVRYLSHLSSRMRMKTWLEHLAMNAQGVPVQTVLLSFKTSSSAEVVETSWPMLEKSQALELLSRYWAVFEQGENRVIPLPAKTADAWAAEMHKTQDEQSAWDKAYKCYHDAFLEYSEDRDVYWQRDFTSLEQMQDTFTQLSEQLWLPLYEYLEDKE
ncbi:exodeoxyribonuclease V subunit gamma [Marinomonas sp. 15G1-11]|uniref:RecBCD enzyme subunit RecC n=1 Tax=Marinomonas phaeophyticola TaxID=3004091 RepID=A0ABT4JNZ1_9GAMM|nr:exodeoxyribonuclease V subunit gamma [Marinomonas sp. 15G1-11]MCZ2720084.1 exodeoxyribonuclease V subunit gamma [Marinomonas sp. 15G1-11]